MANGKEESIISLVGLLEKIHQGGAREKHTLLPESTEVNVWASLSGYEKTKYGTYYEAVCSVK